MTDIGAEVWGLHARRRANWPDRCTAWRQLYDMLRNQREMVEPSGIEPLTSSLRTTRSTN